MGWSQLAKAIAWVALVAFVVWGIYFIVTSIKNHYYGQGRADEKIVWEERELEIANEHAKETSRLTEEANRTRAQLLGSLQREQAARQKLSGDLIDLRIAGLSINTDACNQKHDAGDTENSSTGDSGGGLTRIKLPGGITSGLLDITQNAQLCVIKYYTLRDIVKSMPNVEIVP